MRNFLPRLSSLSKRSLPFFAFFLLSSSKATAQTLLAPQDGKLDTLILDTDLINVFPSKNSEIVSAYRLSIELKRLFGIWIDPHELDALLTKANGNKSIYDDREASSIAVTFDQRSWVVSFTSNNWAIVTLSAKDLGVYILWSDEWKRKNVQPTKQKKQKFEIPLDELGEKFCDDCPDLEIDPQKTPWFEPVDSNVDPEPKDPSVWEPDSIVSRWPAVELFIWSEIIPDGKERSLIEREKTIWFITQARAEFSFIESWSAHYTTLVQEAQNTSKKKFSDLPEVLRWNENAGENQLQKQVHADFMDWKNQSTRYWSENRTNAERMTMIEDLFVRDLKKISSLQNSVQDQITPGETTRVWKIIDRGKNQAKKLKNILSWFNSEEGTIDQQLNTILMRLQTLKKHKTEKEWFLKQLSEKLFQYTKWFDLAEKWIVPEGFTPRQELISTNADLTQKNELLSIKYDSLLQEHNFLQTQMEHQIEKQTLSFGVYQQHLWSYISGNDELRLLLEEKWTELSNLHKTIWTLKEILAEKEHTITQQTHVEATLIAQWLEYQKTIQELQKNHELILLRLELAGNDVWDIQALLDDALWNQQQIAEKNVLLEEKIQKLEWKLKATEKWDQEWDLQSSAAPNKITAMNERLIRENKEYSKTITLLRSKLSWNLSERNLKLEQKVLNFQKRKEQLNFYGVDMCAKNVRVLIKTLCWDPTIDIQVGPKETNALATLIKRWSFVDGDWRYWVLRWDAIDKYKALWNQIIWKESVVNWELPSQVASNMIELMKNIKGFDDWTPQIIDVSFFDGRKTVAHNIGCIFNGTSLIVIDMSYKFFAQPVMDIRSYLNFLSVNYPTHYPVIIRVANQTYDIWGY